MRITLVRDKLEVGEWRDAKGVGWLGVGARLWALRLSPCSVFLPEKLINDNCEGFPKENPSGIQGKVEPKIRVKVVGVGFPHISA